MNVKTARKCGYSSKRTVYHVREDIGISHHPRRKSSGFKKAEQEARKSKTDERYTVYVADVPDEANIEEDEDIFNYDDLDDQSFYSFWTPHPEANALPERAAFFMVGITFPEKMEVFRLERSCVIK
jgi:hypothetical protein